MAPRGARKGAVALAIFKTYAQRVLICVDGLRGRSTSGRIA